MNADVYETLREGLHPRLSAFIRVKFLNLDVLDGRVSAANS
jgi:hypothetical protein